MFKWPSTTICSTASTVQQLDENLDALELMLDARQVQALDTSAAVGEALDGE